MTIDPAAIDPDDVETLGDLVVAAVRDAQRLLAEERDAIVGDATGGFDLDALGLGDMGLPLPPRPRRALTDVYEGPVQDLIDELGRLPGIGPKSAQRIAFHLLTVDPTDIDRLQNALRRVKDEVTFCSICGNVSEGICAGSAPIHVAMRP